jgi:hypothetical protein
MGEAPALQKKASSYATFNIFWRKGESSGRSLQTLKESVKLLKTV